MTYVVIHYLKTYASCYNLIPFVHCKILKLMLRNKCACINIFQIFFSNLSRSNGHSWWLNPWRNLDCNQCEFPRSRIVLTKFLSHFVGNTKLQHWRWEVTEDNGYLQPDMSWSNAFALSGLKDFRWNMIARWTSLNICRIYWPRSTTRWPHPRSKKSSAEIMSFANDIMNLHGRIWWKPHWIFDPPGQGGRIGGHYFWCPYVRLFVCAYIHHKKTKTLQH